MIPFVDMQSQFARIEASVRANLDKVLKHQKFIMGPEVAELETQLAERAEVGHAIGVSSGTDALLMPLMAAEIGPGDAVFVPAFTFTATAEVVLVAGATPVFVDVDADTFNMDPDALRAAVERVVGRTDLTPRCVMAVDLFGLPADYAQLTEVCAHFGMMLLADAAQSFGGRSGNSPVGSLAPVTATSFFPAKPLGAYGDGGAVFTDDDELAEILRSLRAHGKGGAKYDIVRVGLNARLDTMQAAILLAKLEVFDDELAARERLARTYDEALSGLVETPQRPAGLQSAWAQYTIKVADRDGVAERLKAAGIPTAVYYPRPMHEQSCYAEYASEDELFPNASALCKSVLSLPMHPYMDDVVATSVCEAVHAAVAT
jgi:UDP-2-acetamido-2-deoxy-ribo-hexuluronate aminotransferase